MCGITALISFDTKIDKHEFEIFTNTIKYRGEDDFGYLHCDVNNLSLGHRRLSILDLSTAGRQPMTTEDGRYTIIYNGEIFNFIELRELLIKRGVEFISNSDTEVILRGYIHLGVDLLNYLNGMWAFIIYDNYANNLFVSRDRFGIKPLYYYFSSSVLAFSSEPHSFEKLSAFDGLWNFKGISNELASPIFLEGHGQTIFKNVKVFPSGTFMFFDIKQKTIKLTRWWNQKRSLKNSTLSFDDQVERFKYLFFDAVKLRLRSDVPVATALSGGLDSSSVYLSLRHLYSEGQVDTSESNLNAYFAHFPETRYDESKYAFMVKKGFPENFKTVDIDYTNIEGSFLKSLENTGFISGTPLLVMINLYKRMRDNGIKVSIDGHGVDEQLFGYTWMVLQLQHLATQKGETYFSSSLSETYLNLFEENEQKFMAGDLRTMPPYTLYRVLKNIKSNLAGNYQIDQWSGAKVQKIKFRNYDDILLTNFYSTHLPSILRNFDHASMKAGVEVRMPFMDYRLVEFVSSLPVESKVSNGYTKWILRQAMKGIVYDEIRLRRSKIGINSPVFHWFNGSLNGLVLDTIKSKAFTENKFFDGKNILNDVAKGLELRSLDESRCTQLWPYLNLHLIQNH